jgi:hypothetical protein
MIKITRMTVKIQYNWIQLNTIDTYNKIDNDDDDDDTTIQYLQYI